MKRIYLSPPHMSGWELEFVREAFASNWVAPLGPHVDALEREFTEVVSRLESGMDTDERGSGPTDSFLLSPRSSHLLPLHACALSSGTAALHLALRILTGDRGQGTGNGGRRTSRARSDEVFCSTFTFGASANAIAYEGLKPVFIDSDAGSWNMDPGLLREELEACAARGRLPRAVIVVDLYGQCADYDPIVEACAEFEVPLIEDAAEALGATYWGSRADEVRSEKLDARCQKSPEPGAKNQELGRDEVRNQKLEARSQNSETKNDERRTRSVRAAGSFGACAAFSFNGNKIITTAGGGMLVSHDKALTDKARFLATQARDPAPHYQHSEIGFNYRMSNVLAAIGRGQLPVLPQRIAARRSNFEYYQYALGRLPGIEFMPEAPFGRSTRWLTCLIIDPKEFGATGEEVRLALEKENIEARPVWKPMHLQPVFNGCRVRGGDVSEWLFGQGLCLPSGSSLTGQGLERVCAAVRRTYAGGPGQRPSLSARQRSTPEIGDWQRQAAGWMSRDEDRDPERSNRR